MVKNNTWMHSVFSQRIFSKCFMALLMSTLVFTHEQVVAQGTWTALKDTSPVYNLGVMLLLSDGTVMAKGDTCNCDSVGTNLWNKLTPDSHGSYVNGTWSNIAPMHDSRV